MKLANTKTLPLRDHQKTIFIAQHALQRSGLLMKARISVHYCGPKLTLFSKK